MKICLLNLVLTLSLAAQLSMAAPYASCGAKLAELDGVAIYANGEDTSSGVSCSYHRSEFGIEFQSPEFFNRYFHTRYGSPVLIVNAKDLINAAKLKSRFFDTFSPFERIAPQHGDAIVFGATSGFPMGHVGIVDSIDFKNNQLTYFQQNAPVIKGKVSYQNGGIYDPNHRPVLGFIRARDSK